MKRSGELYSQLRIARNALHRFGKGLRRVHRTAYVHRSSKVARDARIAEFAFVGPGCRIDPLVSIGRYSMLASHVAIIGDDHRTDIPGVPTQFSGRPEQRRTRVGDDVWIGYRSIVRRGVRIGSGAIIGAHSVVTRDVEPYEVVAGVPARRLGWRFSEPNDIRSHNNMLAGELMSPSFADPLGTSANGVGE